MEWMLGTVGGGCKGCVQWMMGAVDGMSIAVKVIQTLSLSLCFLSYCFEVTVPVDWEENANK